MEEQVSGVEPPKDGCGALISVVVGLALVIYVLSVVAC